MWDPGLVKIIPLVTPAVGGLCGQIMKRLEGKGKQGVVQLFDGVIHGTPGKSASMRFGEITRASGERWVIDQVESELADRGYMRATVAVRRWPPGRRVQAVVDCEQIQSLAQGCVLAVDRWHRAWAADATLCKAVLDGCAESMWDRRGGG